MMASEQERIARLEGVNEEISRTLLGLDSRMHGLDDRINSLETRMIAMWVTTVGTSVVGFITLFVAILLNT